MADKPKSRSDWIAVLIALAFVFMVGMWLIDTSVGAINTGAEMSNIWIVSSDPIFMYHVGLLLSITSCFIVMLIGVHHILREAR